MDVCPHCGSEYIHTDVYDMFIEDGSDTIIQTDWVTSCYNCHHVLHVEKCTPRWKTNHENTDGDENAF